MYLQTRTGNGDLVTSIIEAGFGLIKALSGGGDSPRPRFTRRPSLPQAGKRVDFPPITLFPPKVKRGWSSEA
jgi:hypothetical protein